jgi:hypothetical protein
VYSSFSDTCRVGTLKYNCAALVSNFAHNYFSFLLDCFGLLGLFEFGSVIGLWYVFMLLIVQPSICVCELHFILKRVLQ